ncbi:hypothetical protein GIB67_031163 [Kingdonia uniflora]|uniref:Uncharacterized protein n=1 Tax=Kingdonia uniflora TaxID=39325 RepID=A0A7J7NKN6_9MAGN|nr:hypothetical protein GIB67_031163 [Kingdonia uniflora]
MKSDKEVNEQVDEEDQTQEGGAKKGTSNAKNYTSRCTGFGLYKMFTALPEEENEIFDHHLVDMKLQFRETIIQMKPIHVCLILGLRVSPVTKEFLFVNPEHMTNFRLRQFPKNMNTYGLKEIDDALKQAKLERHHEDVLRFNLLKIILSFLLPNKGKNVWVKYVDLRYQIEAPAIGTAPAIGAPAVSAPVIGNSSSTTEIEAVLVRWEIVLYHLEILHSLGSTSSLLMRNPQNTSENEKAEEADVPNKKKKDEGLKKKAFTDDQFDHVPLIQLKTLIPKIPKKGLANRVPRKRRVKFLELENIQSIAKNLLQQVAPGEGLKVVNDLMVDDDVEVGREVYFKAISSEYGGDLLGTMVVAEVAKINLVFFNQYEVVGEAYHASADQTTIIYVKEQTLEVEKTEDDASQASADQTTVVSVEEQAIEVTQTEEVISYQEEDVGEASLLVLMESEVNVTLKKRHVLTEEEINEIAFKMACQMNQLHTYLDELLPGVLLKSFIQRPISQDEKNQVEVWSLRKVELFLEAKKDNRSTYMRIGEETVCLNALYTLYPNQWLDNEVIDVYIKALIQYFGIQHRARPDKERIVLTDIVYYHTNIIQMFKEPNRP